MQRGTLGVASGLAVLLVGAALVAYAVATHAASVGVFLIFPFVVGSSAPLAVGVLLLVLGIFLTMVAWAWRTAELLEEEGVATALPHAENGGAQAIAPGPRSAYGGFLLIGPVPIVWGHGPRWLPLVLALVAATVLAVLLFLFLLTA